jgi:hypothetical protein
LLVFGADDEKTPEDAMRAQTVGLVKRRMKRREKEMATKEVPH